MTQPALRNADMLPHPLRDYGWVSDVLPGKVGPTDIDFCLERNGKVLILEFKPAGVEPGIGQLLTLMAFQEMGCDVWLVQGPEGSHIMNYRVSRLAAGNWVAASITSAVGLAGDVRRWFLYA